MQSIKIMRRVLFVVLLFCSTMLSAAEIYQMRISNPTESFQTGRTTIGIKLDYYSRNNYDDLSLKWNHGEHDYPYSQYEFDHDMVITDAIAAGILVENGDWLEYTHYYDEFGAELNTGRLTYTFSVTLADADSDWEEDDEYIGITVAEQAGSPISFLNYNPELAQAVAEMLGLSGNEVRSGTVTSGDWQYYGPFQTSGAFNAALSMTTGDADIYVARNRTPSSTDYDCRPYLGGTNSEECSFTESGEYYIAVNGYDA